MTDAVELSLKQILDSVWVRRLGRAAMIIMLPLVTGGGSVIGWIIWQNYQVSLAASEAAEKAVSIADDVRSEQSIRSTLADQRAQAELTWRTRLDSKVTTLISEVGQLKGIVSRDREAVAPWLPFPYPSADDVGQVEIASDLTQEYR